MTCYICSNRVTSKTSQQLPYDGYDRTICGKCIAEHPSIFDTLNDDTHDGAEHRVATVAALDTRTDLQFLSDYQDTAAIRYDFGPEWDGFKYDSYFVAIADGEYTEIWGMSGTVPYKSKLVTQLV